MDVYSHLQGLGWRGSGFSLDKTDRGLKKPLLISRKFDSRGVGSKTQSGRQADHWWLRAYDSALSTLGDGNQSGTSVLHQVQGGGYKSSWLDINFTRGESLPSTFTALPHGNPESSSTNSTSTPDMAVKEEIKERARVRRAREKQEVRDANHIARMTARRQAIEEGTFDFEKDKRRRQEIEISRLVNTEIKKRTLQEEFGPVLPTPTELLKMEKDADKAGPAKFHETELAKLSVKVHGAPEPGKPYKKVSYKTEKYKREKLIREAKRDLKARLKHDWFGEPYVDETNMTEDEKKARREAEKEAQRQQSHEARKLEKYAKAAESSVSAEKYIAKKARKLQEKSEKSSIAQSEDDTEKAEDVNGEPSATEQRRAGSGVKITTILSEYKTVKVATATNGAKSDTISDGQDDAEADFVVDATGDLSLAEAGFCIDATGDPDILHGPRPTLVWHPDMLGDRNVKELSKGERRARLEWMRERRRVRNQMLGKSGMSKAERRKIRVEKKMAKRNRIVADIMREKGKPREESTKEELLNARRAAKMQMRELKRDKRNKVIHRTKLGENLRGAYGGISQG